jgi:hypothetical protein
VLLAAPSGLGQNIVQGQPGLAKRSLEGPFPSSIVEISSEIKERRNRIGHPKRSHGDHLVGLQRPTVYSLPSVRAATNDHHLDTSHLDAV